MDCLSTPVPSKTDLKLAFGLVNAGLEYNRTTPASLQTSKCPGNPFGGKAFGGVNKVGQTFSNPSHHSY